LRRVTSGDAFQLTFDGAKDFGYATNNAGWTRDKTPVVKWSPDSKKIATFQHDGRNVKEMALWSTKVGHPDIDVWKYPLAGDENIFVIERVVIHISDVTNPQIVRLKVPADPHRSSTSDHIAGSDGEFLDTQWSADSLALSFLSSSRDHKVAQLRTANIHTGEVREVYREETETYFESGFDGENWRVFHERGEFLWFSERSGWGHLYLHDLFSGEVKAQITAGDWPVHKLEKVDLDNNQLYFTAAGRNSLDPYFHALYRVNLDGRNLTNLTPEPINHFLSWSNSKNFFVDKYSAPTTPPVTVIRDTQGGVVMKLSEVNVSDLKFRGWVPPEPFVVKARDDETDLYGLMYKPSNFDDSSSYPVLNYIYPGPQTGSIGARTFQPARADKQAIAELGFIVVELDAMGTPGRSKKFHDAYYGNLGDNGLPDQISGLKQLAEKYSWMDLDRVGVWGHSGGGFASTAAILRYPDFYKVAVAGAGNHDNRNYEDDWGEKWHGLLEVVELNGKLDDPNGLLRGTNYDSQANQLLVDNLKGKLLLAHGMMDANVHPSNTLLVVDALIKAEKDFDLVLFPNAGHGFGNSRYFMKRRWDYFVNHLSDYDSVSEFRFASNIP
jgi:dipeptidyl aminopeptidase/acylaminoacyl peptidase